ncbi:hypothetical protein ACI2K4_01940 [Micromonospora sp. NPDC050397]|uniref:hypothetical protein n=1 Tax=Micromonospora sp. NPDC050397 TaxID=3364279 RepID=UPI00384B1446
MSEERVAELIRRTDPGDGPALPDGYAERLATAGRRNVRRRRAVGASIAVVLLLAVGVLGFRPLPPDPPRPSGAGDSASLPDRLAPYSFRTGTIGDDPLDRAIMIFKYGSGETVNLWQSLAIGANGNSYRQLDEVDPGTPWLLTADGRNVVMVDPSGVTDTFTVLELATGVRRQLRLPRMAVALLATSPDGRYVAYSAVPFQGRPSVIGEAEQTAREQGTLTILDLVDGRTTALAGVAPASAASFSPDGASLAVQLGAETWIVGRDGQRQRRVAVPRGHVLVPRVAWSPDGRLLAIRRDEQSRWSDTSGTVDPYEIRFADATAGADADAGASTGSVLPPPVSAEELLGWRSPDQLVALALDGITELSLTGAAPVLLTRRDQGRSCEYRMQPCMTLEIRVATALLPDLTVRRGDDPDRGRWPAPVRQVAAVATLLGVGLVTLVVWRRRSR